MYEYDREKDKLIIKLEAAEKAYMSLLYDYTELKAEKEKIESAMKEVKDLLDYLIDHNYASKDKSEKEKDEGSITRSPRISG
jgi:chromosome segregation ATPase